MWQREGGSLSALRLNYLLSAVQRVGLFHYICDDIFEISDPHTDDMQSMQTATSLTLQHEVFECNEG